MIVLRHARAFAPLRRRVVDLEEARRPIAKACGARVEASAEQEHLRAALADEVGERLIDEPRAHLHGEQQRSKDHPPYPKA